MNARALKTSPLVLTARETCALLRIHRPKVYQLIAEGALQGVKCGADWRIQRKSVEALIGPIPESFFDNDSTRRKRRNSRAAKLRTSPVRA
jgi:excisionase family DNA binding protein